MIKKMKSNFLIFSHLPKSYLGAIYKIVASLSFALVNLCVRFLSGGAHFFDIEPLPYTQIAFLQNFVGLIFLLPMFFLRNKKDFNKTKNFTLKAGYVLFAVMGLILWYGSLHYLPLTTCVSLGFLGPIFTIFGCFVFLNENLTYLRVISLFTGIMGAFLITRPDRIFNDPEFFLEGIIVMLPILSTLMWVISKLFGRVLAKRGESAQNMTFYMLIFMAPVSFIPSIADWITPSLSQIFWVMVISFLSTLAHFCLARSYGLSELSFLMPFGFVRLLASGFLGYIFFNEIPHGIGSWLGMTIVLLSLVILAFDRKIYLKPENLSAPKAILP